uniref:Uncharacterized protein n=1 Tax=Amphimedon queenslandica TaxID=400682 RepID=A0A1X7UVM7_AMPQE
MAFTQLISISMLTIYIIWQKFSKAEVDSLDDFVEVVEQSCAVNKAQPVGKAKITVFVAEKKEVWEKNKRDRGERTDEKWDSDKERGVSTKGNRKLELMEKAGDRGEVVRRWERKQRQGRRQGQVKGLGQSEKRERNLKGSEDNTEECGVKAESKNEEEEEEGKEGREEGKEGSDEAKEEEEAIVQQ